MMDAPVTGSAGSRLELTPVDISAFAAGNTGIAYVTTFDSGKAGPHLLINALTHGNEVCGAHALEFLFNTGVRPARGKLTLSFANVAAYESFDEDRPGASRYLDEDFNRLWSDALLDGERNSRELTRARELRPIVEQVDHLLDLHSMQTESPPLALAGTTAKGRSLAIGVGVPAHVVVDAGHAEGTRMRDYGAFGDGGDAKSALLVECGQHWMRRSREVAIECALRFLGHFGVIDGDSAADHWPAADPAPQRFIEVTEAITIRNGGFKFSDAYRGLEVIPAKGTLIGSDAGIEVRTPYDDCVLVMPSRKLRAGQTAVRFGRYI